MKRRDKVFIAGRLTKNSSEAQKQQFTSLAEKLGKGTSFVFPTLYAEPLASWEDSIRSDVSKLMECTELHLLANWHGHRRSEILRDTAIRVGIHVHYH